MKKSITALFGLLACSPAFAAVPVNLSHQSMTFLAAQKHSLAIQEQSRAMDFKGTLHIRVTQTFQGYPVWGGDGVIHIPGAGASDRKWESTAKAEIFMNGTVYQQLQADLSQTPAYVFTENQAQSALEKLIVANHDKGVENKISQLMVYIDKNNKAHWAFKISYRVPGSLGVMPQKPVFIVDAINFTVYAHWDDVKTQQDVKAGGFIGNHKTGQKLLDGLNGNLLPLIVQRDVKNKICFMKNENVSLLDARAYYAPMQFDCQNPDAGHNLVYWNGNHDQVETTWSPSNDVMFGLEVTRRLYQEWYNMPVLVENGKPMHIPVIVHDPMENAGWLGDKAIFGDSVDSEMFNPFTQLDTVVHEISHGFTEQHSNLLYVGQSGGLNESFSDIVGIAAEYFVFGSTKFLVGWGDVKANDKALRYMDQPSRDCEGRLPGEGCSIDHVDQYDDYLDPHYSSGIFNRFYYTLANSPDWNPHKALDILVQANAHYWTSLSSYFDAACNVMRATRDYKYDEKAVANAFQMVGIDTNKC